MQVVPIESEIEIEILPPEKTIHFTGAVHPLKTEVVHFDFPVGYSLQEMLHEAQPDPILRQEAHIYIDDMEIPRENWAKVRPKAGHDVTAQIVPFVRGGRLRQLLQIGVILAAVFFGGPLGTFLGISSIAAAGLITVAGTLLINQIAPLRPPTLATRSASRISESPSLFITGSRNEGRPFRVVPCVLGTFRFRPPLGAKNFTETQGRFNFLNMLLVVGFGRLHMTDWRIGDTPIEEFQGIQFQQREGRVNDEPITLFPNQVIQTDLNINLPEGMAEPAVRVAPSNADRLSVDIAAPRGFFQSENDGSISQVAQSIRIEYRRANSEDAWMTPDPDNFTTTGQTNFVNNPAQAEPYNILYFNVLGRSQNPIRWNVSWPVPRDDYEVRVWHIQPVLGRARRVNQMVWSALRSITNEAPIQNAPVPLAMAALRIQATDQLNGAIDNLSVLATSYALDWDAETSTWTNRRTNNPASLFRHVLQGPAAATPIPTSQIDLDQLVDWHGFCRLMGFTFNAVIDSERSVLDVLKDIAAAGRASVDIRDGKWSVVIDRPRNRVRNFITPRNSRDFRAQRLFAEVPHAWRIRFPDQTNNYNQTQRTVYNGDYNESTATIFETIEFPGVTDPDQIWKLGRYYGAVATQRPERWTVVQDFEALVAERGSRVRLGHDVLLIGITAGRIRAVNVNSAGQLVSLDLDEPVTMEPGKRYSLDIRRSNRDNQATRPFPADTLQTIPLLGRAGTGSTVFPAASASITDIPLAGDLFTFGETGMVTEDAIVVSIQPNDDLSARLTLVPYRGDIIFAASEGAVPPYTPFITTDVLAPPPAPTVQGIITDEDAIQVRNGTLQIGVNLSVAPIADTDARLEVQQRIAGSGGDWEASTFEMTGNGSVRITGVRTNENLDFRVRWNNTNLIVAGPWIDLQNTHIIGTGTRPGPLRGLNASVSGDHALLRWDAVTEIDVIEGGRIEFRHSRVSDRWSMAVPIGQAARGNDLQAVMPFLPGYYMARVFDADNNASRVVRIFTEDSSLFTYESVDDIDESIDFFPTASMVPRADDTGTTQNIIWERSDNSIYLAGNVLMDNYPEIDSVDNWDFFGGVSDEGIYGFDDMMDFGEVRNVRLTSIIDMVIMRNYHFDTGNTIDERESLMDSWPDFDDADDTIGGSVCIEERHTSDDPTDEDAVWSSFQRLDVGTYRGRAFQFRGCFATTDLDVSPTVIGMGANRFGVRADVLEVAVADPPPVETAPPVEPEPDPKPQHIGGGGGMKTEEALNALLARLVASRDAKRAARGLPPTTPDWRPPWWNEPDT